MAFRAGAEFDFAFASIALALKYAQMYDCHLFIAFPAQMFDAEFVESAFHILESGIDVIGVPVLFFRKDTQRKLSDILMNPDRATKIIELSKLFTESGSNRIKMNEFTDLELSVPITESHIFKSFGPVSLMNQVQMAVYLVSKSYLSESSNPIFWGNTDHFFLDSVIFSRNGDESILIIQSWDELLLFNVEESDKYDAGSIYDISMLEQFRSAKRDDLIRKIKFRGSYTSQDIFQRFSTFEPTRGRVLAASTTFVTSNTLAKVCNYRCKSLPL